MVSSKPKDRLTPAFEIRPRGFEPLAFGSGEDGTKGSLRFLKGFGSSENPKKRSRTLKTEVCYPNAIQGGAQLANIEAAVRR
jgi:hypothetical protein